MRRLVVLSALCLAACGNEAPAVECDAAAGVSWNGVSYLLQEVDPPRPPAGDLLDGEVLVCNEPVSYRLRAVEGTPTEVAVYQDGSISGVYVNHRYFVFLGDRDHPPPRPFGSPSCTLEGTVVSTWPLRVRTERRRWRVRVDADTRFARFDSSLPYLAEGDRVRVRGHQCRGQGMVPRRIEALP
jgi:hypothetical protein